LDQAIHSLYREGYYYADKLMQKFSLNKFADEYEKFTERFARLYPGYKLDDKCRLRADTAKTINL
jgi:hypothetical protein